MLADEYCTSFDWILHQYIFHHNNMENQYSIENRDISSSSTRVRIYPPNKLPSLQQLDSFLSLYQNSFSFFNVNIRTFHINLQSLLLRWRLPTFALFFYDFVSCICNLHATNQSSHIIYLSPLKWASILFETNGQNHENDNEVICREERGTPLQFSVTEHFFKCPSIAVWFNP